MEIRPDFDAGEVARTVAVAVSNLHKSGAVSSSDSGNDETPLIVQRKRASASESAMPINDDVAAADTDHLVGGGGGHTTKFRRFVERIPARYVLTLLGFLGFCNVYALRVNLSVAMVAMVNHTTNTPQQAHECGGNISGNATLLPKEGEFSWSSSTQATILGSFFWGYLVTQVPGGRMAERGGGKWLFGGGVLLTSLLTLLTPLAARGGVAPLVALRVMEGLGEGVTFPAMHAMLGAWLPKYERSLLCTIIYSGAQIGTVISMPISGILCDSEWGWPSVFYVFGALGCVWFVFWALLVHESPEAHPRISKAELALIQTSKGEDQRSLKGAIPWRCILTSVPVWTLVLTHFGQNWGFYTFLTELPTYLSAILHFDIRSDGFLSALPYLLQAVVSWGTSFFADWLRRNNKFSVTTIRKGSNTIGFLGPAVCLGGVILAGCNSGWSVLFLTLAMGFNGATYAGYMVTHVDMAPDYAGTLMGMTNCFATIAGFLAPKAVGALTENNETLGQWRIVFLIAIGVYVSTGALFVAFGSATLQDWGGGEAKKEGQDKSSDIDDK